MRAPIVMLALALGGRATTISAPIHEPEHPCYPTGEYITVGDYTDAANRIHGFLTRRIPEPSRLLLLGLALSLLVVLRVLTPRR